MIKKSLIIASTMGFLFANSMSAYQPENRVNPFDIHSIEYIEEEPEIDLGFDPTEYLPEDFDPYRFYFDLNSVEYIEEADIHVDLNKNLPKDFNAYAIPSDFRAISYLDPRDDIKFDIDTEKHLSEDFDPYIRK